MAGGGHRVRANPIAASVVATCILGHDAITYARDVPDALDGMRTGAVGFAVTLTLPTRGIGLTLTLAEALAHRLA